MLVVDFREAAPRAARRDIFTSAAAGRHAAVLHRGTARLGSARARSPVSPSRTAAAGVCPGRPSSAPPSSLARDGFVMTDDISIPIAKPNTAQRLAADPETAAIFLPDGAAAGRRDAIFRQPDLARTLEAIRDRGHDGFYRGRVARQFEEGQKRDRRAHLARRPRAVRGQGPHGRCSSASPGAEVLTTPAPSSGPVLAEMALLADRARPGQVAAPGRAGGALARGGRETRASATATGTWAIRLSAESARGSSPTRRAVASRSRRRSILRRATPSGVPARVSAREALDDALLRRWTAAGGAVAVTTTVERLLRQRAGRAGPRLPLNNEMDDFATRPGEAQHATA